MRYRLRTLLILMAVGPPVLAGVAWLAGVGSAGPLATGIAIYVALTALLVLLSKTLEAISPNRPQGICAFCLKSGWPLAEGPNSVLICRDCAINCLKLIDDQMAEADALRKTDPRFKTDWPSDRKTNPLKVK